MPLTADDIACLRTFFDHVDSDGSGKIAFQEIRDACAVDTDGDGTVEDSEIIESARPWLEAFASQDLDSDQLISFQELLAYNAAN